TAARVNPTGHCRGVSVQSQRRRDAEIIAEEVAIEVVGVHGRFAHIGGEAGKAEVGFPGVAAVVAVTSLHAIVHIKDGRCHDNPIRRGRVRISVNRYPILVRIGGGEKGTVTGWANTSLPLASLLTSVGQLVSSTKLTVLM